MEIGKYDVLLDVSVTSQKLELPIQEYEPEFIPHTTSLVNDKMVMQVKLLVTIRRRRPELCVLGEILESGRNETSRPLIKINSLLQSMWYAKEKLECKLFQSLAFESPQCVHCTFLYFLDIVLRIVNKKMVFCYNFKAGGSSTYAQAQYRVMP